MSVFWMEHRYSASSYRLPCHYENVYQILFLLSGKIAYSVGDRRYQVSKGGIVVLNTLEEHTLEVLEYPYERYVIQIQPEFFQQQVKYPEIIAIFVKRPASFSHLLRVAFPVWEELYGIIQEMEREYQEGKKYWELFVGADLCRMFVAIYRECAEALSLLKVGTGVTIAYQVMNYLNSHYREEISVDQIAAGLFLSRDYISHIFKEETGFSLIGYVISLRINRAKLLLSETDKSVTDIAVECGYTDFAYFTKQFKKCTGMSPSSFRKKMYEEKCLGQKE